jgi:small-conductance mechanosensitive channel
VLLYGVRALALRACKRLGPTHPFAGVFLEVVRKTRLWFLVALAVELVLGFLHAPADVARTAGFLFTVATRCRWAIWARRLILGLISLRVGDQENEPGHLASAMGIIKLLISIAVFTIAAVVILDNLGVNVTGLVAGLGIGGIAIGLAAQGIFADLFAALSIIFDKPFQVGDTIVYQGKEGPVTGKVVGSA